MPPAVRIQRTSRRPARAIAPPSASGPGKRLHGARQVGVGLGVAGEAPEQRHDAVEPEREERGQRRLRRRRDLEHDDAAARAHDARHLGAARARGRRSCAPRSRPSRRRRRRRGRAARARCPTPSARRARAGLRARPLEHPLREVRADTSPPGRTRRASSIARSPVPVATSSARLPGPTLREVGRALAPAVVQPGRHDRVHDVVEARDAVEHRADLTLLERPRVARRAERIDGRLLAVQLREEVDQRGLLVLGQVAVRGHRGGRVLERPPDRGLGQLVARSRSGAGRGRRCRSRRSCGRRGSPTGPSTSLPASYFLATFRSISFGEPAEAPR